MGYSGQAAVDENERHLERKLINLCVRSPRGAEDDAVDLLGEAAHNLGLDHGIFVRVRDEQPVSGRARPRLCAPANGTEERVLEVWHNEPDTAGTPGDEAPCGTVGPVAHRAGGVLDVNAGSFCDHLGRRESPGDRRNGHAGSAGNVADRHDHFRHHLVRPHCRCSMHRVPTILQTFSVFRQGLALTHQRCPRNRFVAS